MRLYKDTIYKLELFVVDTDGEPKPGLSTSYNIYKSSDDSSVDTGVLTDVGNGVYKSSYQFSSLGQFRIVYNTPSGYTDEIESILVTEETAKNSDMLRTLGLSDENKKILDTVHDGNGNITSAVIKIYPSATDFENDTNVYATYIYSATYDLDGLMTNMGIKRTS